MSPVPVVVLMLFGALTWHSGQSFSSNPIARRTRPLSALPPSGGTDADGPSNAINASTKTHNEGSFASTALTRETLLRQCVATTASMAAALFPASATASSAGSAATVLVTGANSGIGKAIAKQLAGKGYRVVLGCREVEKARATAAAIGAVHGDAATLCPASPLDLADLASVAAFAAEVRAALPSLGGLVLCAGIDGAPETTTAQGQELHMAVNHLGHMLLAAELTGPLRAHARTSPARVLSVTSSAALDADPQLFDDLTWARHRYDKRQAYCVSKACNILFADHLAAREEGTILAAAVDPGPAVTQIVRYALPQRAQQREGMTSAQLERQARQLGFRTPAEAGHGVASLASGTGETELVSGGLYLGIAAAPGQLRPLFTAPVMWRTPAVATKVWGASVDLIRPYASERAVLV